MSEPIELGRYRAERVEAEAEKALRPEIIQEAGRAEARARQERGDGVIFLQEVAMRRTWT